MISWFCQIYYYITYNNMIQQFLQQHLYRHIDHQLISKIQQQHQSVECLLFNLSRMKTLPKHETVLHKIQKAQKFHSLNRAILELIDIDSTSAIIHWILTQIQHDQFLTELIKKFMPQIENQIIKLIKQSFMNHNALTQQVQTSKCISKYIVALKQIGQVTQANQIPQRVSLLPVDSLEVQIQHHYSNLLKRVESFNVSLLQFLHKLYQFEEQITQSFSLFFESKQKDQKTRSMAHSQVQQTPRKKLQETNFNKLASQNNPFAQSMLPISSFVRPSSKLSLKSKKSIT